ncbi:MFS transporter permease [Peribacillus sp. NPDC097295]|uniref:MFS transporter permease n=1 Tax=Peribacillus sp. NPDC097295 TaxID=3364402 RepID=UPI003829CA10
MRKSDILMILSFVVAVGMIVKAFILDEEVKVFLLVFFAVGLGLALLRLFVNGAIKKMKGKDWKVKVLFFAVLLGFGLPFQSWFRKEVLFSMDRAYLVSSIIIMILGVLFMTTFFGYMMRKMNAKKLTV